MLVATRDPSLHSGAQAGPPAHAPSTGVTRVMNLLQIVGTALAIPVGLASGYSIYHANFSVDARCHSLRGNIVSMLDKSADAATLRMLVRRDVVTFEQSCSAVDPNAVAAFKTLLAKGKSAAPVAVVRSAPEKPHAKEDKPAKEVRVAAKAAKVVHATKDVHRPARLSDAKWLAAVREALVRNHEAAEAKREPQPVATPPIARVMQAPAATASIARPAPAVPPAPMVQPAPVMQPAPTMRATVAPAPAPAATPQMASDHPVPPALIPDAPPSAR